jgi:hypothetical protein
MKDRLRAVFLLERPRAISFCFHTARTSFESVGVKKAAQAALQQIVSFRGTIDDRAPC